MGNFLAKMMVGLVVILLITLALVQGLSHLANSRAELAEAQGRARAMVIEAQGQARLDTALAASITTNALLPWFIVLAVAVLGGVVVLVLARQQPARLLPPPVEREKIIERYILFLPQEKRQDVYRAFSRYMQSRLPEREERR